LEGVTLVDMKRGKGKRNCWSYSNGKHSPAEGSEREKLALKGKTNLSKRNYETCMCGGKKKDVLLRKDWGVKNKRL